jgi:hypothetical protein
VKAGYCFFFSASTSDAASSWRVTAATCTKYPPVAVVLVAEDAALVAVDAGACDCCVWLAGAAASAVEGAASVVLFDPTYKN